jgi:3D (Asp-Asp-Asp) domain-containing protein
MKKILTKAYVFAVTAAAFVATVAPAIIRADVAPATPGAPGTPGGQEQTESLTMRVTAYSSSPDETDDTPFITASGIKVRDGIVATNVLPFGTKIKLPSLFGDKIFTVEDRMSRRLKNTIDIWMSTKQKALRFGVAQAKVVIVTNEVLSLK